MRVPSTLGLTRDRALAVAAPLFCLFVAAFLFALFGIHGHLSRDESIYMYGGQQILRGVPPYVSIFDPKTPGAHFLAAAGIAIAKLYGGDQVLAARVLFFVSACLTAVAMYLLGRRIWGSWIAGVVAALVFCCFSGYAADALDGPGAKTPGLLFSVLAMWLLAGRRWLWAGFCGALAFLTWQPFGIYALLAVVLPLFQAGPRRRVRQAAAGLVGVVVPIAVCVAYFAIKGALSEFISDGFLFAINGVQHKTQSVSDRFQLIRKVISTSYGLSGVLLQIGMAVVLVAGIGVVARSGPSGRRWGSPLFAVLLTSMVFEIAYALTDFQGYQDVFPFLPYGALGIAGVVPLFSAAAAPLRAGLRPVVLAAPLTALVVLLAFTAVWFRQSRDYALIKQVKRTCELVSLAAPGSTLYGLGDPTPLVLSQRTNPNRYIWVDPNDATWKIQHTKGGMGGWVRQILASNPAVIVMHGWVGTKEHRMAAQLKKHGFTGHMVLGEWTLLSPSAAARFRAQRAAGTVPSLSATKHHLPSNCVNETGPA